MSRLGCVVSLVVICIACGGAPHLSAQTIHTPSRLPAVELPTTAPVSRIAAALRKIDYSGYVVMEPFLMPGGQVGSDIKVFRDLSVGLDLDEEARKALLFMRGVLK